MQENKNKQRDPAKNQDIEHLKYEIAQELGLQDRKNKNKDKTRKTDK